MNDHFYYPTLAAALSPLDYAVVVIYLLAVVILGSWIGRGQNSTTAYLLASRRMNWIVVAVSIMATDLSATTYMGTPGWSYNHDLKYYVGFVFMPVILLLVVVLFARVYFRLKLFTVYEYLEYRFHPLARTIVAVLFLFQRSIWLAGAIYIPSLAVITASGLVLGKTTNLALVGCIVAIGGLTTVYTMIGGIKAVFWTDFLQFLVLAGGLLVMIGIVLSGLGWDIAGVWTKAGSMTASETNTPYTTMVDWTFDLKTESAIWTLWFYLLIYQLGTYGTDQVVAQRYFSVDSMRKVAQAVVGSAFLTLGTVFALAFFGLLLVAYYDAHPDLAATLSRPDQILPHFAVHALPNGIRGLIIAAILAATMSSVSSGLNSFATVGVMDLYTRLFAKTTNPEDAKLLLLAKALTLVSGIVVTALAVWISTRDTNIVRTVGELASKFIGPITGIFLMGILTKRGNIVGVVFGALAGLVLAYLFSEPPIKDNVNWMWTAPMTCLATFVVGWMASLCTIVRKTDT